MINLVIIAMATPLIIIYLEIKQTHPEMIDTLLEDHGLLPFIVLMIAMMVTIIAGFFYIMLRDTFRYLTPESRYRPPISRPSRRPGSTAVNVADAEAIASRIESRISTALTTNSSEHSQTLETLFAKFRVIGHEV